MSNERNEWTAEDFREDAIVALEAWEAMSEEERAEVECYNRIDIGNVPFNIDEDRNGYLGHGTGTWGDAAADVESIAEAMADIANYADDYELENSDDEDEDE